MPQSSVYDVVTASVSGALRAREFHLFAANLKLLVVFAFLGSLVLPAKADDVQSPRNRTSIIGALKRAYPDFVSGLEGNSVVFKDGRRIVFDDGKFKTFDQWLAAPDIKDMFRQAYPWGAVIAPPARDFDPGRARNEDFFRNIYGDCRKPEFLKSLTTVRWLPFKSQQTIEVTTINGAAQRLQEVSSELDALPARFAEYLLPAAGGFNCRTIAGTSRRSTHAYGIAIDIALKHSDYWRWQRGSSAYENHVPTEIVAVFEKHGFIWGGRWSHYDTMHFEYRPELLQSGRP